jgi:hypothetical protein
MAAQAKIGEKLGVMDRKQLLDSLYLNHYLFLHNDIHPIGTIQVNLFVDDRQALLPNVRNRILMQLKTKTFLIRRFQQSWTQMAMDFNRQPNNALRQRASVRKTHLLRVLRGSVVQIAFS